MFSTVQGIPKTDHQIVTAAMTSEMPASERMTLGSRQIAAVSFVILTMLALVASVAYLAGRMVTPVIATATESRPVAPAPEQLYVVEAAQMAAVAQPPTAPAVIPARPTAISAAVSTSIPSATVARPIPEAAPVPAAPAFPLAYFQVASVDRGMADVSVEYLKKNSLPAFAAPGATPSLFRVMVGPAASPEEAARFKNTLLKLGFTPFSKRL